MASTARPATATLRSAECEHDIADGELGAERRAGSPQQRAASRGQFGDLERLDQIVVRARVQAQHPVVEPAARGQDQDRHHILPPPQRANEIQPLAIGQAEIEQHQIIIVDPQRMLRAIDGFAPVDGEALTVEPLADQARQARIIFNQQQAH